MTPIHAPTRGSGLRMGLESATNHRTIVVAGEALCRAVAPPPRKEPPHARVWPSFSGLAAGRKLTKSELIRAVRYLVAAEYEAVQMYIQLAESIDDKLAREVLKDIADEERVHAGEFLRLLHHLAPDEAKFYKEGADEVEEGDEKARDQGEEVGSRRAMDLEKEMALLIDSRFPIVTVETWEEERIEGLVRRVTDRLEIPFFTWTALKGICRDGNADSIHETERPLGALEYIERLGVDSVYLFKDFHHYLQDPAVLRKLRDICGVFRRKRKSIVLLSPRIEVPVDLAKDVVDLEIPFRRRRRWPASSKRSFATSRRPSPISGSIRTMRRGGRSRGRWSASRSSRRSASS